MKDALGNVIHDTYVTISNLQNIIREEINKRLSNS